MTRLAKIGFWLAAASCLLLAVERGQAPRRVVEAAAQPGAKASTPETPGGMGLIDVQQSDLEQTAIEDNWVSYNGDYTGRRYSSMTQITPANAGHLVAKWVFHTQEVGPLEVTPVVVAGVMFLTSANAAYALDAKTGMELWHHARAITEGLIDDASSHHNRGVAILGTRVYMETDNAHLLCLDARSGERDLGCSVCHGQQELWSNERTSDRKEQGVGGHIRRRRRRARLSGSIRCTDGQ